MISAVNIGRTIRLGIKREVVCEFELLIPEDEDPAAMTAVAKNFFGPVVSDAMAAGDGYHKVNRDLRKAWKELIAKRAEIDETP